MAVDNLKIFCNTAVVDGVTETSNRRTILDEEYLNGWVRQATVSTQQVNSILYLLSTFSAPYAHCIYMMDDSEDTPSTALDLDGSTFTEEDYPNLYEIYSGTLPDYTSVAPTGIKYIIRAS